MANINIEVTDTELKAMQYIAADPVEWADNAVTNRARIAIDEIVALYTARALDEGVQIPTSRDAIVADAYTRNWIQTAAERNAETAAVEE